MSDPQTALAIKNLQRQVERLRKHELSLGVPWYARGRPTLTTGTPVTTADVTGSVIYWTPYYAGWFDELSLDINPTTSGDTVLGSPTVSNIPDTRSLGVGMTITGAGIPGGTTVAAIPDSTTVTMSANASATAAGVAITFGIATDENWDLQLDVQNFILSPVQWSTFGLGTSTRAVPISYDRGIPYLSTTQYKLLGTFRTSAANTISDTRQSRFVSSVYNRVERFLRQTTNYATSHNYNGAAWRNYNNSATETLIEWVECLSSTPFKLHADTGQLSGSTALLSYLISGVYGDFAGGATARLQPFNGSQSWDISDGYYYPVGYNDCILRERALAGNPVFQFAINKGYIFG